MYSIIEKLINIDYNSRKIDKLYDAIRKLSSKSILEEIADVISEIPAGKYVILTTGSVTRSWVTPRIGETDGPIGTAVLAKRIRELTGAIPIIFTEPTLVESIGHVVQCAGLSVVSLEQAEMAQIESKRGQTSVACILPFTENSLEAEAQAAKVLTEIKPALLISIEKAGRNEAGIYHNMRGHDYSKGRCRIDYLFEMAKDKGLVTVGVGDGGNEIGMGLVNDAVKKYVPYGGMCQCGCEKGIGAKTETSFLLTGSVSNWACYAICASLALKHNDVTLLHTAMDEARLIDEAISAGMVDGSTGAANTTVDGFSKKANCAMVALIEELTIKELEKEKKKARS